MLEYIFFTELINFLKTDCINKQVFTNFILRIFDMIIRDTSRINISQEKINKIKNIKYYKNRKDLEVRKVKKEEMNKASMQIYGKIIMDNQIINEDGDIGIKTSLSDIGGDDSYQDDDEYKAEYSSKFGDSGDIDNEQLAEFNQQYVEKMQQLNEREDVEVDEEDNLDIDSSEFGEVNYW